MATFSCNFTSAVFIVQGRTLFLFWKTLKIDFEKLRFDKNHCIAFQLDYLRRENSKSFSVNRKEYDFKMPVFVRITDEVKILLDTSENLLRWPAVFFRDLLQLQNYDPHYHLPNFRFGQNFSEKFILWKLVTWTICNKNSGTSISQSLLVIALLCEWRPHCHLNILYWLAWSVMNFLVRSRGFRFLQFLRAVNRLKNYFAQFYQSWWISICILLK